MKSLHDYIIESTSPEENADNLDEKKTFSFDFSKFENAKETIQAIVSSASDFVTDSTETSVKLSFKKSDATKLNAVVEIVKAFLKKEAHTTKRSSDEQFAQYCSKQENVFNDFEDFVTKPAEPEEQPNVEAQKEEEEKEKDEQE